MAGLGTIVDVAKRIRSLFWAGNRMPPRHARELLSTRDLADPGDPGRPAAIRYPLGWIWGRVGRCRGPLRDTGGRGGDVRRRAHRGRFALRQRIPLSSAQMGRGFVRLATLRRRSPSAAGNRRDRTVRRE